MGGGERAEIPRARVSIAPAVWSTTGGAAQGGELSDHRLDCQRVDNLDKRGRPERESVDPNARGDFHHRLSL